MSSWQRLHLNDSIKAMAIPQLGRFLVRVRQPQGEGSEPVEFYCWNLENAQIRADRLVHAYYPHECDEQTCGYWQKLDS